MESGHCGCAWSKSLQVGIHTVYYTDSVFAIKSDALRDGLQTFSSR